MEGGHRPAQRGRGRGQRDAKPLRRAIDLAMALILAVVACLGLFAGAAARIPAATRDADMVLVLTGGAGRIEAGLSLLAAGRGRVLLISGVHRDVRDSDIALRWTGPPEQYRCCVYLGREANNTIGNAHEAAMFARARHIRSILVVTADYHLPRALLLLRREMPDLVLRPFPVRAPRAQARQWWSDAGAFRRVGVEFFKYFAVAARELAAGRAVWPLAHSLERSDSRFNGNGTKDR